MNPYLLLLICLLAAVAFLSDRASQHFDRLELVDTRCPNPLSHPVGYGRNGEHL